MAQALRPRFRVCLILFLTFFCTLLLGASHTLFAVIQASQSNPYGVGAYGQGQFGCGYVPTQTPSGEGASGSGGTKYVPPDLLLSQDLIKVKLKQGETKPVPLTINNTGSLPQSLRIELKDLTEFILLSHSSFILNPFEERIVTLHLTAPETDSPQLYTTEMIMRSSYVQKIVPIVIEVPVSKALFDITVKVPQEFKTIEPGKEIAADTTIYNLGDLMPVDVSATYSIISFAGNITELENETLAIDEKKTITRRFPIQENLPQGTYILQVLLEYGDQQLLATDVFEVKRFPEEQRLAFWGRLKQYPMKFTLPSLALAFALVIAIYSLHNFWKKRN